MHMQGLCIEAHADVRMSRMLRVIRLDMHKVRPTLEKWPGEPETQKWVGVVSVKGALATLLH